LGFQAGQKPAGGPVEIKGGAVQVGEEREVVGPLSIRGYDVAAADSGGELDDGAEEIGWLPRRRKSG
jgi:hypothetical protein